MFEQLDATRSLTANQRRIVVAAILGDMLEFFDYFLIGFVLAFIVGPWQLSFGQSAIILLSSGIGAFSARPYGGGWLIASADASCSSARFSTFLSPPAFSR
jgi:putative MFS transporter